MLEKDLVHLERAGKILIGWDQHLAVPAIVAPAKQSQQLARWHRGGWRDVMGGAVLSVLLAVGIGVCVFLVAWLVGKL